MRILPINLFRKYAKEAFEDNELALEKRRYPRELNLRQQIAHYLFNSKGFRVIPIKSSLDLLQSVAKHDYRFT